MTEKEKIKLINIEIEKIESILENLMEYGTDLEDRDITRLIGKLSADLIMAIDIDFMPKINKILNN